VNCRKSLDEAQAAFEACDRGELDIAFVEIYSQSEAESEARRRGSAVVEAAYDAAESELDGRADGKHVISAFCQYGPAQAAAADWDSGLREAARRQVFELIDRFAPGTSDSVIECEVLAPPDVEERIGLTGGCIFQGECFPEQMWDRRLAPRTPIDGFYLCGAATHPGGSVIGLNGRNAAMAALSDRSA
jgi:phytoene dehydrogenase-like protein